MQRSEKRNPQQQRIRQFGATRWGEMDCKWAQENILGGWKYSKPGLWWWWHHSINLLKSMTVYLPWLNSMICNDTWTKCNYYFKNNMCVFTHREEYMCIHAHTHTYVYAQCLAQSKNLKDVHHICYHYWNVYLLLLNLLFHILYIIVALK